ncbi:GlcG/HbpS family heme-binding protein [Pseudomonas capsici]|uniref:GlcG/HbpS family heme-binding protein n=1 Tax=Pseudomonas capsici TaxID=2810614 RepID=UPI0021F18441|nr:heme-binding protein [Pseudomonas capsici]MCV4340649.1 heme-binding protein [Pseudomonas capsici]
MHSRPTLDAQEITMRLDVGLAEATCNGWLVSVAVVDDGGHLLAFRSWQGATSSSAQIGIDKARSAALTRRPIRFFADMLSTGQPGAVFLHNVMPMPGGLPLLHEGQCLGGIAASGVRADFDEQIVTAGIAAIALTEQRDN